MSSDEPLSLASANRTLYAVPITGATGLEFSVFLPVSLLENRLTLIVCVCECNFVFRDDTFFMRSFFLYIVNLCLKK